MIKLSEFSKTFNINLRLLHHFKNEHLLSSVYVDDRNGVQYCNENLLNRINKILLYKTHGYRLAEIREIIDLCFDKQDNEIKDEEVMIELMDIHARRMLEEIESLAKDYEPEDIIDSIEHMNELLYM